YSKSAEHFSAGSPRLQFVSEEKRQADDKDGDADLVQPVRAQGLFERELALFLFCGGACPLICLRLKCGGSMQWWRRWRRRLLRWFCRSWGWDRWGRLLRGSGLWGRLSFGSRLCCK